MPSLTARTHHSAAIAVVVAVIIARATALPATAQTNSARELHEATRLYVLALAASDTDIHGALTLLSDADNQLAGVHGSTPIDASAGELAAHVRNARRLLAARHARLAEVAGDAGKLLDHRHLPRAALARLAEIRACSRDGARTSLTSDTLSEPCWPRSDTHFNPDAVRTSAELALTTSDALVRRADRAAAGCADAHTAIDNYRAARDVNAAVLVETRITRAKSCLSGPSWTAVAGVVGVIAGSYILMRTHR